MIKKIISSKKLVKLARKWQRMAAIHRKRITMPKANNADSCSTSSTVEKGHFVLHSIDHRRSVLPLKYLDNEIVKDLFTLAEEEFGLASNSPLVSPCDAGFMEYAIDLIQRHMTKDVEKALLMSISNTCCSTELYHHESVSSQQMPICSF